MGRWEPNARGRLEQAAMELFIERGFEQTTVTEIATRAGLTQRTFFRYFADKREVLFWGAGALQELLVSTVASAPDSTAPIERGHHGPGGRRPGVPGAPRISRRRQAVIDANPELRERELIKLATLASAIAGALRQRGVSDPAASLTAEAGIAVFKIALLYELLLFPDRRADGFCTRTQLRRLTRQGDGQHQVESSTHRRRLLQR